MQQNSNIYYGILFYFVYIRLFQIVTDLIVMPVFCFNLNVTIIPIALTLMILLFNFVYLKMKKFPRLLIWIVLILVYSVVKLLFNIPTRFYPYSDSEKAWAIQSIYICTGIHTFVFVVLSCIKFIKSKTEK